MSKMNQDERRAAEALDRQLSKLLRGEATPAADDLAQTSQQLVTLANSIEPRPEFEKRLRQQLLAQANIQMEQNKQLSLFQTLEEGIRRLQMKRLLVSAAGLTAVLLVGFFGWWYFQTQPIGNEPSFGIAARPEDGTQNVDTQSGSGLEPPAAEQPVGVENAPQPLVEEAALDSRYGMGGGGYGYAEGEGPFSNASISLDAELPTVTESTIYQMPSPHQPGTPDLEALRDFAAKMGIEGDVYFEWYSGLPKDGTDDGNGNVPYVYRIFDGRKMATTYGSGELGYEDTALFNEQQNDTALPFAERAALAEAFAQEHGLIDFEYVTRPSWGTEVQFYPVVDGKPLYNWTVLTMNILSDGQVVSVWKRPLQSMSQTDVEALRSANEAWTYLQDNFQDGPLMFNIIPSNPQFYGPPRVEPGQKYHWEQAYEPGQEVVLNSWVQIYRPADGSITPRLVTDRGMVLEGDAATLEAIAEFATQGNNVRLTGTVSGEPNNLRLAVTDWEGITGPSDIHLTGTTRLIDGVMNLELPGGFRIQIANPPADLPVDEAVSMSSWGVRYADDGVSAITDWVTLDLAYYHNPEMVEEPILDPYANISNVTITNVELAYYYLHPFEPLPFTSESYSSEEASHLIPVWRFAGETNNGDRVEFMVTAVASMELPTRPTE